MPVYLFHCAYTNDGRFLPWQRNSHIFYKEILSCGKHFKSWTYNWNLWLRFSQAPSYIVVGWLAEGRKMWDFRSAQKEKVLCNNTNIRSNWWWSLSLHKDCLLAVAKVSKRMGYLPLMHWKYLQEMLKGLLSLCISSLKDISKFIVLVLTKFVH